MALQSLEKLAHPLEKLIQKHEPKRTRADIARVMAEISFALEVSEQKGSQTDLEYKKEFKARAKYYEGYLSKYLSRSSKPEIEMLLLMSRAINCNLEELTEIFYPDYFPLSQSCHNSEDSLQPIIQVLPHVNMQTHLPEMTVVQEFNDFRILEISIKVEYTKGSYNTVRWEKTFKLVALKDNLKVLDKFDYYKCVRDKAEVEITCSGDFKIRREQALDSDDNVVTIIFDKPLHQSQEVEFSLSYFCSEVIEKDIGFHCNWIRQPIDLLHMEIIPPEPEKNRQAKYYVHLNKGCPLGIEKIIEAADVFLDAESGSYKLEIPHPNLYTTCGVYWGRNYW